MEYNYSDFSSDEYNLNDFHGPSAGEKAPDFDVIDVTNEPRKILEFSGPFLVLELGSITCPLFQSRRSGMERLKAEFPECSHAVLYVREAHPGQSISAHKSLSDKVDTACVLRDADKESRDILIDDLAGTAHRAYGGYPNAVFIINQSGCVVYRSAWNNVVATRRALKRALAGKPVRSEGLFFPAKPPVALHTLRQAGPGAGMDFLKSLPTLVWKNLIRRNFLILMGRQKAINPDAGC